MTASRQEARMKQRKLFSGLLDMRSKLTQSYIEIHTSTIGCLKHFWICFKGQEGRTDAGAPHSLGSVSTGAGAVVAASRILADLIVSALMRPVSALIDVYRRP